MKNQTQMPLFHGSDILFSWWGYSPTTFIAGIYFLGLQLTWKKIPVELLDFALLKSWVFVCPNDYNLICLQG